MYKIIALIGNDLEILCKKTGSGSEIKYCLPSASANSIKAAQSKIKLDLKKLDINIFFDNLIYKNESSHEVILIYNCILKSFSLQKLNEYEWLSIKNYIDNQTYYDNEDVEKWIKNHFIKFINLEKELTELKDLLYDQSETKIEIQLHLDSIKFFINSNHAFCPFAFCVDYNIEDEDVCYNFRWQIVRPIAPGNKSDIYIFFLSSMAALLKMKCNVPVFIAVGNYLGIPFEINTGCIYFEMDHTKTRKKLKDFAHVILLNFDNFNLMMMAHNRYFGTIANELLETDKNLASEKIFEHFGEYEKICRQETTLLYNDRIFYIELDTDNYNYNELIKGYEYELLKGVNGALLFQKCNCEQKSHVLIENYIDDKTWEIINFIIKKNKIKNYQLCAQSNMIFIFTAEGLWGITGNYHHKLAEEERENLLKRQNNENRLLFINRRFKWKYPLNPSRFEQLIAELIEQQKPMAKVRLVGKTNNADGGRDILVYEKINYEEKLTIVQCKAYKNSVNKHHVMDIRDTIEHYDASGFFLATSSNITTQLNDYLIKLKNKYEIDWWTEREIFKLLKQYPIIVNDYEDLLEIIN